MNDRSLSSEYYQRERRNTNQFLLQKLNSQQLRITILELKDELNNGVKKRVWNDRIRINNETSNARIEPTLHFYQTQVRDLRKILMNRDYQIIQLRLQNQRYQRRIQNLEFDIQDLQNESKKAQYSCRATINQLLSELSESQSQKKEYNSKIAQLQEEKKKSQEYYKDIIKKAQQSYDFQSNSLKQTSKAYKQAKQQIMKNITKDLKSQFQQFNTLKDNMNNMEIETVEKLKTYSDRIFYLDKKLNFTKLQLDYLLRTNKSDIDAKNKLIEELQKRLKDKVLSFEKEIQDSRNQKKLIEESKKEMEIKLMQKLEKAHSQRRDIQAKLHQLTIQLDDLKYQKVIVDRKCNDYSNKLEISEVQKKHSIQKLQQEIQQLKKDNKIQIQREIQLIKKSYQPKISILKIELEQKNDEIASLRQKIQKLDRSIQEKNLEIKAYKDKQDQHIKKQFLNKSQIESRNLDIEKLKRSNELLKQRFKIEKKQITNEYRRQSLNRERPATQRFDNHFGNLNNQVSFKTTNETNLKKENPSQMREEKKEVPEKQLSNLSVNLSQIPSSTSVVYDKQLQEHQKEVQQLKDTVYQQKKDLQKDAQKIKQLQKQLAKVQSQKLQKQETINKLQKQLELLKNEREQDIKKTINKYTQLKDQSQKFNNNYQKLYGIYIICQRQNHDLKEKLFLLQKAYNDLKFQHESTHKLNTSLTTILINTQDIKSELNVKKSQNSEPIQTISKNIQTITQDFKDAYKKIKTANQRYAEQIAVLQSKNLQLTESNKNKDLQIIVLQKEIKLKNSQCEYLQQKLSSKNYQNKLVQQKLKLQSQLVNSLQKKQLQIQKQKQQLTKNLSQQTDKLQRYQIFSQQLKKLNIYEIKQIQKLLDNNNSLKQQLQDKNLKIQHQIKLTEDLETKLSQAYKLFDQQKVIFEKQFTKKISDQYNQLLQQKIQEIKLTNDSKVQKLTEKISELENQIQRKNQQLRKVNRKMRQSQTFVQQEQKKIDSLQKKLSNQIKIKQKLQKDNKELKKKIQQLQKQAINLKKQKRNQHLDNNNQRINQQQQRQLNPLEKIANYRKKVEKIQEKRQKIYKTLNEEHKKIVDIMAKHNGPFLDLSTRGCLDQMRQLIKLVGQRKEENNNLKEYIKSMMRQNHSMSKKFQKFMGGFREQFKRMETLEEQLQERNLKWQYIIGYNVESHSEQKPQQSQFGLNQNSRIRKNNEQNELQWALFDDQFENNSAEVRQSIPTVYSKVDESVIQSNLSDETETVKKEKRRQEPQTLPKPIKLNQRYSQEEKEK